jgi:hypothetical protein
MRDTNQLLGLFFVALGAAVLSIGPQSGAYDQLVEFQARMAGLGHASQADRFAFTTDYAWAIRAGGVFVLVLGAGLLVIPWINALVFRRPNPVIID